MKPFGGAPLGAALRDEPVEAASWVEQALAEAPDQPPPRDGLARVMAGIDAAPRAPARAPEWTGAVAASLGGVVLAAGGIAGAGVWLLGSPQLLGLSLPALGPLGSLGLAAVLFFAAGSFATLALAPVLMLESAARRPVHSGR